MSEKREPKRKRENQVKFYLNDDELKILEKKVKKSKLKKTEYLRKSALEKDIFVIGGIRQLAYQLSKIGNNINQLTKLINQGIISDTGDLKKLEEEYQRVFEEILEISKKVN